LDYGAVGLINLPPTPQQKRSALVVIAVLATALACVAPFAATPLPRFAAFIPFLNAAILVTDLITALLLFAQFSLYRSRALLVLASTYLFTALIVVPHALTFPGAFSPTGLLGAGHQTTAWLYLFWHFGFPAGLLAYAFLKDGEAAMAASVRQTVVWAVAGTLALVVGLVLIATIGDPLLPRLFIDATHISPIGAYAPRFDMVVCVAALGVLWVRRRSVLDLWLMVVTCSLIGELAVTVIRFSLGFYASRIFSLATSTIVLIILLVETTRLYTRLAHSNAELQRERDNKLMNLEAVVAAISHELKQPLSALLVKSATALLFLDRTPPDYQKVRSTLGQIVAQVHRASNVLNNIRELFTNAKGAVSPINVNEIVSETIELMRDDLMRHHVTVRVQLMPAPPLSLAHAGQLQEVLLNLIRNAIDAMDAVKNKRRFLRLTTADYRRDAVAVTVEDSGPGIAAEKVDTIFDAFVTTKPQGMGLGLALSRMIIERHSGQLVAVPSHKGGVFQIILPIAPMTESPTLQGGETAIAPGAPQAKAEPDPATPLR
jgi:signal transduction histidine kinase